MNMNTHTGDTQEEIDQNFFSELSPIRVVGNRQMKNKSIIKEKKIAYDKFKEKMTNDHGKGQLNSPSSSVVIQPG